MDIKDIRSMGIRNRLLEEWDLAPLLEILRDPSENLTMIDRNLIADILEGNLKRGKGAPRDQKTRERQLRSCQVFLKYIHKGDKVSFAYEYAAEELGVSVKTVKDHVRVMRDNPRALYRMLFDYAAPLDCIESEEP